MQSPGVFKVQQENQKAKQERAGGSMRGDKVRERMRGELRKSCVEGFGFQSHRSL